MLAATFAKAMLAGIGFADANYGAVHATMCGFSWLLRNLQPKLLIVWRAVSVSIT